MDWKKWLSLAGGAIIVLIFLAYLIFTSSFFLKRVALPIAGNFLKMEIKADSIDLDGLSKISIQNLKLTPNNEETILEAAEIQISLSSFSSPISIEEVFLDKASINIVQTPDGGNLAAVLALFAAEEEEKAPLELSLVLKNLIIQNSSVKWRMIGEDDSLMGAELKNINLTGKEIGNELNGKVYHSKFASCQHGFLTIQSSPADMGFYIVPDEAVKDLNVDESFLIGNYSSSKAKRDEINEKLLGYRSDDLIVTTKLEIATNNIGTGAMVIFIGLYIGLVFLISCAAILALKELSQCIDNKEKYQILRKIGVDEKMINKSLFIQIAIYFAFPLILALIHSIFGIQVCKLMLESSGQLNVFGAIKITILFLIIIYGGYFYITYLSAKNIIKER